MDWCGVFANLRTGIRLWSVYHPMCLSTHCNECEYMISVLLGEGKISLDNDYHLRDSYIERNLFFVCL